MKISTYIPFFIGSVLVLGVLQACDDPGRDLCNAFDPVSRCYVPPTSAKFFLIQHFTGKDPYRNNLEGCHRTEIWAHATLKTEHGTKPEDVIRGTGFSLKITFDISAQNDSKASYVEGLGGRNKNCKFLPYLDLKAQGFDLDALGITYLSFWIKAQPPEIDFEVALTDSSSFDVIKSPKVYYQHYLSPEASDSHWRKALIPISRLVADANPNTHDPDPTKLRELFFIFSSQLPKKAPRKGIVYIDDIAFEK